MLLPDHYITRFLVNNQWREESIAAFFGHTNIDLTLPPAAFAFLSSLQHRWPSGVALIRVLTMDLEMLQRYFIDRL